MADKEIRQNSEQESINLTDKFLLQDGVSNATKYATAETLQGFVSEGGWMPLSANLSVQSGYNKGRKEFVFDSDTDLTGILSESMRLKGDRDIATPTQCADFEASSSQYASIASPVNLSVTDDITIEAWVNPESYTASTGGAIMGRGTTTNGWVLRLSASGVLVITGYNAGASDQGVAYQSPPLSEWTHVAATINMSSAVTTFYIDGEAIAQATYTNGAPTAFVNSGTLSIGSFNSGSYLFDGKMCEVRLWHEVRTATQIRDNMYKRLTGAETNLAGYWPLDGNFEDLTANNNDMTPNGSATATTASHPWHDTEYLIVTKVTSTQVTVFGGTDYAVPNMTMSNFYFSTQRAPFGFPASRNKWYVKAFYRSTATQNSPVANTWYNPGSVKLSVPTGSWVVSYQGPMQVSDNTSSTGWHQISVSTSPSSETNMEFTTAHGISGTGLTTAFVVSPAYGSQGIELSQQTDLYLIQKVDVAADFIGYAVGSAASLVFKAECAYL